MSGVEREREQERQQADTVDPQAAEESRQRRAANQRDLDEQQALYAALTAEQRLQSQAPASPPGAQA